MRSHLLAFLLAPLIANAELVVNSTAVQPGCGINNGSIDISVSGGLPPYTFAWADGPISEDRADLPPGSYSLTVTDATLATVVENVTLLETLPASHTGIVNYAGGFECPGEQNGSFRLLIELLTGQAPYSVNMTVNGAPWSQSGTDDNGNPIFSGLATNDAIGYTVVDANECSGGDQFMMYGPLGIPAALLDNLPACGTHPGSITVQPDLSDWLVDLDVRNDQNQSVGSTYQTTDPLVLTDLVPGDYTVYQTYTWSLVNGGCFLMDNFTIGDLGPDCGSVSGMVYIDNDQDCTQDVAEVGVPYEVLAIAPGPQYAITDATGAFAFDLVNGSYDLSQTGAELVQLCPAGVPVPFTVADNVTIIDLADSSTVPLDLTAQLESGPMRPGFSGTFWGLVRNFSPQVSGAVSVIMELDLALTYSSAVPTPTNVSGNTISWELAEFTAYQQQAFTVVVDVPPGTPIGTSLTSTLFVSNTLPEGGLAPNLATLNNAVVGSYDPNVKTARTSTGYSTSQFFIGQDDWIDYTINFQNTGADTAFTVVVTDTLAAELDMATFEQGVASYPFAVAFKPGRVVEWRFANILLPDSSTNEAESHGLVGFRIRPVQPLLPGTTLSNTANIFFDFNEPVITAPSVLTAEFSTGISEQASDVKLFPNPATNSIALSGMPNARWTITALDGRWLASGMLNTEPGTVDVRILSDGMYLIRLYTDRQQRTIPFQKLSQ